MLKNSHFKTSIFVIGAAKSGTSWLFECLREHPETLLSSTGEIDFFSYYYHKGREWYQHQFEWNKASKIVVDISPSYFTDPHCPRKMYEYNPESKIILIVRHPLSRAYSHYCMHLRGGKVTDNIENELRPGTRYLEDSMYFKYLSEYLKVFPKHQVAIFNYDDLVNDPKRYFQQVCRVISINPDFVPTLIDKKYHQKKGIPKYQGLYNSLVKISNKIIKNPQLRVLATLIDKFRQTKYVNLVHRLIGSHDNFPLLSTKKSEELMSIFREDLKRLEEITGNDYSNWYTDNEVFTGTN